jgi:hypothetical protein
VCNDGRFGRVDPFIPKLFLAFKKQSNNHLKRERERRRKGTENEKERKKEKEQGQEKGERERKRIAE